MGFVTLSKLQKLQVLTKLQALLNVLLPREESSGLHWTQAQKYKWHQPSQTSSCSISHPSQPLERPQTGTGKAPRVDVERAQKDNGLCFVGFCKEKVALNYLLDKLLLQAEVKRCKTAKADCTSKE